MEGAHLAIYDPKVTVAQIHADLGIDETNTQVRIHKDAYAAADKAHAIALLTEWDELREDQTDYRKIFDSMEKPAFFFDGRNLVDLEALREIGFEAHGIGKP